MERNNGVRHCVLYKLKLSHRHSCYATLPNRTALKVYCRPVAVVALFTGDAASFLRDAIISLVTSLLTEWKSTEEYRPLQFTCSKQYQQRQKATTDAVTDAHRRADMSS